MANGWLIFLGLVSGYMLLLVWLTRSGRMEKWNLSLLLGFILMMRTQRGRGLLAWTAKPRRFWNLFGDIGVVATYLVMALISLVMLLLIPIVLSPSSGVRSLGASEILVIPGVNPFVPLWYGIIALIVTLVVHEGGHGVLALANKMRVKSVGLLFAIVPVGAFVEPDEDDMVESSRRARLRVYAAGPSVNFAVAAMTLTVFALLVGSLAPVEGAPITGIEIDQPAALAGFLPGDILIAADGQPIPSWSAFIEFMDTTSVGQEVSFSVADGGMRDATIGSRWNAFSPELQGEVFDESETGIALCDAFLGAGTYASGADCAAQLEEMPFLGVRTIPEPIAGSSVQEVLAQPFGNSGRNLLIYMGLPLGEIQGTPYLGAYLPDYHTTPFDATTFWILVNLMFWISWINLMVGMTNALPMLPLDGGHLFRDGVAGIFQKLRPNAEPEARDRVVGKIAGAVSLIIFGAFLLQIFGPRIAGAFA